VLPATVSAVTWATVKRLAHEGQPVTEDISKPALAAALGALDGLHAFGEQGLAERQVGNPGPGPSVEREGAVFRQGLDPFAVGDGLDLPQAEPVPHHRLLQVAEGCQFGIDLIDHPTPAVVGRAHSGVAHDPQK
jgi:hypothetical protein